MNSKVITFFKALLIIAIVALNIWLVIFSFTSHFIPSLGLIQLLQFIPIFKDKLHLRYRKVIITVFVASILVVYPICKLTGCAEMPLGMAIFTGFIITCGCWALLKYCFRTLLDKLPTNEPPASNNAALSSKMFIYVLGILVFFIIDLAAFIYLSIFSNVLWLHIAWYTINALLCIFSLLKLQTKKKRLQGIAFLLGFNVFILLGLWDANVTAELEEITPFFAGISLLTSVFFLSLFAIDKRQQPTAEITKE